jgi:hypothetical protein
MNPLDSPRWKLDRAREHLASLETEIGAFLVQHPYEVVREQNAETGVEEVKIRIVGRPPFPVRFGGLVGDVASALRASLDHLVWAMSTNPQRVESVEFPIFSDQTHYSGNAPKRIGAIHTDAQTEIERIQPYHAGNRYEDHPLWRIHKLANTDKHRLLPVVAHGFVYSVQIAGTGRGIAATLSLREGLDEDPCIPIPAMPAEFVGAFNFKIEPTLAVVVQDAGRSLMLPMRELGSLYHYVQGVVFPALERFVPKS